MQRDTQQMLREDPDYIAIKRYGNSLVALAERYPGGCPDHIIAQALGITEKQVETRYRKIIACLRRKMRVF